MSNSSKSIRTAVFKDSVFYLLIKVIPGITGLASIIIFMRWVGPEGYGQYTLFLSFIMAVGALSAGWLNQAVLRYFSRYKDQGKGVLKQAIQSGLWISLGLGVLVLVISGYFFLGVRGPLYFVIIFLLVSIIIFRLRATIYQAGIKPRKVTWFVTYQALLGLIIPIVLLLFFQSFQSILLGLALAYLIPSLSTGIRSAKVRKNQINHKKIFSDTVKKFMLFGSPISLSISLILLIPFFDRFLIDFFFGSVRTGAYASFSELITRLYSVILFPITLAVHPRMTYYWNNGAKELTRKLWNTALIMQTAIFAGTFLFCLFFNQWIFNIIHFALSDLDPYYQSLLLPLLASGFLWQISMLIHKPLELEEKPIYMAMGALIALLVSIVSNVIFLPRFGVIATAYTSIISALIYISFVVLFSRKGKEAISGL